MSEQRPSYAQQARDQLAAKLTPEFMAQHYPTAPLDLRELELRWLEDGPHSEVALLIAALREARTVVRPFLAMDAIEATGTVGRPTQRWHVCRVTVEQWERAAAWLDAVKDE